jgi:cysteinyl-tRNA synthetase
VVVLQEKAMVIKLYNTLTKKKENFEPVKAGVVGMYNCGPTVYDRAHIGNLRSYVFADLLKRTLEYSDLKVHQIVNITDVGHLVSDADSGDDKMTKALKREGRPLTLESMHEIGTKYSALFIKDLQALNIELPDEFPRASDHISDDIDIISELEKKGFTYKTTDGIYFETSKFPHYGKLGNIKIKDGQNEARINNAEKKNPSDFALWKFDEKIGWESPWGKGFPGWHIECSAMSRKFLGQPFDIHTGGIDHIPVHHNNEIAQSEAAYGIPLANYWMHNEFLTIHKEKMAKSEDNFFTLDTLNEHVISPLSYRYWLLTAHYRSPIDFSLNALEAAQTALIRLIKTVSEFPDDGKINHKYQEQFREFINDDIDTPKALALSWDLIKDHEVSPADKKATLINFDKIFGLNLDTIKTDHSHEEIPAEIKALAEARESARQEKEWDKADALRLEIESRGYEVKDTPQGFSLESKS